MNKTLEAQLLTLIAVVKKMQNEIKNNAASFNEEINSVLEQTKTSSTDINNSIKSILSIINDKSSINTLETKLSVLNRDLKALESKLYDELSSKIDTKQDKIDIKNEIDKSIEHLASKSELETIDQKIKSIDVKNEIQKIIKDYATKNELQAILTTLPKEPQIEKIVETIKEETKFIEPIIKAGKVKTVDAGTDAVVEIRKVEDVYYLDFLIPRGVSGRGQAGLTTNVNGIEQVNGRIDLTTDDIPATEDNQYIATNEVALIHIEQQVYVLSGSAGSSFSLKTPSNINITSYEIETDVNCTCVVSIEDTNVSLTNEKTKLGETNINKLANESITVSVDSNDNANWIKVYLNGVKL